MIIRSGKCRYFKSGTINNGSVFTTCTSNYEFEYMYVGVSEGGGGWRNWLKVKDTCTV